MKTIRPLVWVITLCWLAVVASEVRSEITVTTNRVSTEQAVAEYRFTEVAVPSRNDLGESATFALVAGERDRNGGRLEKLHDGKLPTDADQPAENFFFSAGSDGGRLLVDLGKTTAIGQVHTYSWHPAGRGPQVYTLFGSTGEQEGFDARPGRDKDPVTCGWSVLAQVDTRPAGEESLGGQYGVNIHGGAEAIGSYRYLLFDMMPTAANDPFGHTFYSEIDIMAPGATPVAAVPATGSEAAKELRQEIVTTEQGHRIVIDTTDSPDLTEWVQQELAPVVKEWYPKIIAMLPSDGYEAPKNVSITFSERMQGVAATGGTRVSCASTWFRRELEGEAKGAIVHELVHVVQQYGRARGRGRARPPGWLVEGIPDYIRWYLYEPQSRGAEIRQQNIARARYDGSYRISANFLNWVTGQHDPELVRKLNAAIRDGAYSEAMWKELTGMSVEELDGKWREQLASPAAEQAAP